MPQLGVQRAYLLSDRRAILLNRRSLAGHAIEPGPLPERLHDDDQVQPTSPLAQHGRRRRRGLGAGSGRCPSRPWVRQGGQTMALAVWLSTDALHEVTGADTTDADGDAERADTDAGHPGQWTPGHPDTRTLDTGRADIARADTGHLTPDAWTLTEDADRATKPRQASGHLGRHDEPMTCWTPNRVPVGGSACGARQP